jgi:NCAIR mutase (PurE)-related protein
MSKNKILTILEEVEAGKISAQDALLSLKMEPFEDLGFARLDHHRELRQGIAEVIYGAGKSPQQISDIIRAMKARGQDRILVTRLEAGDAAQVDQSLGMVYQEMPKLGLVGPIPQPDGIGKIIIATGGTSDMPVAEEAALTAQMLGNDVVRLYDVGVAGIHRLFANLDELMSARVVIAIAGMEGALASVIGGLVSCPVIGVPTSVGYGTSFQGMTAMLSMLNSCASGVSVVNIDNGFGAGYLASMINHM